MYHTRLYQSILPIKADHQKELMLLDQTIVPAVVQQQYLKDKMHRHQISLYDQLWSQPIETCLEEVRSHLAILFVIL